MPASCWSCDVLQINQRSLGRGWGSSGPSLWLSGPGAASKPSTGQFLQQDHWQSHRREDRPIAGVLEEEAVYQTDAEATRHSTLMDLLLWLSGACHTATLQQGILYWLNEERIIQWLVGLIIRVRTKIDSPMYLRLCDITRLGREQGGQLPKAPELDPLFTVLE